MLTNQISDKTIAEWGNLNLPEAARVVPLSNAQSLFCYLKFGEDIVEAPRGGQ